MSFSVTILGSSSALPTSERFPTAHVLNVHERFFLIDCGEGTQIRLRQFKIKLGKINHIFISHFHGDHIFGLFGLIASFNLLGRTSKLHIYGPEQVEDLYLDHMKYFNNEMNYEVVMHKIQTRRPALIYQDKLIEVMTIPLVHRIPTCGFLFREKPAQKNIRKDMIEKYNLSIKDIVSIKNGADFMAKDGQVIPNVELTMAPSPPRAYAYCSDTVFSEKTASYIGAVDLLYHEATFLHEDRNLARDTMHSTTFQAAETAKRAGAKKLLIGHFSSRYKNYNLFEEEAKQVFENSIAVNDGDVFSIPRESSLSQ